MTGPEIDRLIYLLSRLPGLGPRSARRIALHLMKKKDSVLKPLSDSLAETSQVIVTCDQCGGLDSCTPCHICIHPGRDRSLLCVVEDVDDLWAIEKSGSYKGLYHVVGGTLSALAGVKPEDLSIAALLRRVGTLAVTEVILALSATVEGQTTAHYINDRLAAAHPSLTLTRLAHGVPLGGELHYLDGGTLTAALKARQRV